MGLYEQANNVVKANLGQLADTSARAGRESLKKSLLELEEQRRGMRFELDSLVREQAARAAERERAEAELLKWKGLLELAQSKRRDDLADQARARVAEHSHHVGDLAKEERLLAQRRGLLAERLTGLDKVISSLRRGSFTMTPSRLQADKASSPAAERPLVDSLEADILALADEE